MNQVAKCNRVSPKFALLASTLMLLSSCSEKPAEEAAMDAKEASYAGPQISASAAPNVAFVYDYAFSLPNSAVAVLQEQNAAACEKLGPTQCQITGMRYDLVRGGNVTGSLSVSLDRNIARSFGKDGVAAAGKLGGKLTSASIEGQDLAGQIAAAKRESTSSALQIADIEKQLAQPNLGDRERAELRNQLESLRSARDESRNSQSAAETQIALTPMTLRYYGSGEMALSDNPITSAGGAFLASATSILSILLFGLAYGLPWIIAALLIIALWRTTPAKKLRAFVAPTKAEN